jgi:8-oxo-dGTP pyrophosphatase MutT (NUDIX family)
MTKKAKSKANQRDDEIVNPWKIHTSEQKYDNPWISVTEHSVTTPGGEPGIYGVVHFKNYAIAVLPIDDDGNAYLVGQYRFATQEYSWEVPEGGGKMDQSPLESAMRELKEETGLEAEQWSMIHELHLSNSATDERGFVFVAKKLKQGKSEPEDTEDLKVEKIPFEELYQRVMRGEYRDALTIVAVLKAKALMDNDGL